MSERRSHPSMPASPKTVGSLASCTLLNHPFSQAECDVIEFRLDGLVRSLPEVKNKLIELKQSPLQTLITARCPTEGGENELTLEQRSQLLMGLSPLATFVDIELANLEAMAETARYAQSMNALVIASFHDFKKTPTADILRDKIKQSIDQGADIAKIAVFHNSIDDIHTCAQVLQEGHSIAVSLMGMGSLAPSSRLLYAQLGSVLNYGYIGKKSTAPGQWPAEMLHQAIQNSPQF
mgnify:CR=1 FL=1